MNHFHFSLIQARDRNQKNTFPDQPQNQNLNKESIQTNKAFDSSVHIIIYTKQKNYQYKRQNPKTTIPKLIPFTKNYANDHRHQGYPDDELDCRGSRNIVAVTMCLQRGGGRSLSSCSSCCCCF